MYVCMYMHVCTCMYVCMYVHACMCMYVCTCTYVCMHACMHVCMHMYVCMYVCMHACMHVCMYVCMYVCVLIDLGVPAVMGAFCFQGRAGTFAGALGSRGSLAIVCRGNAKMNGDQRIDRITNVGRRVPIVSLSSFERCKLCSVYMCER